MVVAFLLVASLTQAQQVINLDQITRRQDSILNTQKVAEFKLPSDQKIDAVMYVVTDVWDKHYNMLHSEYLHILCGKGKVEFENGIHNIYPGAVLLIPQKTWFSMTNTGKKPIKLIAYRSPAPPQRDDVYFVE